MLLLAMVTSALAGPGAASFDAQTLLTAAPGAKEAQAELSALYNDRQAKLDAEQTRLAAMTDPAAQQVAAAELQAVATAYQEELAKAEADSVQALLPKVEGQVEERAKADGIAFAFDRTALITDGTSSCTAAVVEGRPCIAAAPTWVAVDFSGAPAADETAQAELTAFRERTGVSWVISSQAFAYSSLPACDWDDVVTQGACPPRPFDASRTAWVDKGAAVQSNPEIQGDLDNAYADAKERLDAEEKRISEKHGPSGYGAMQDLQDLHTARQNYEAALMRLYERLVAVHGHRMDLAVAQRARAEGFVAVFDAGALLWATPERDWTQTAASALHDDRDTGLPAGPAAPCDFGKVAACRDACDQGDALACTMAAYALRHGHGVDEDTGAALLLAERACEAGDLDGCAQEADARFRAAPTKARTAELAALHALCERGAPQACLTIAETSRETWGYRLAFLERACQDRRVPGSGRSCDLLASAVKQQAPDRHRKLTVKACTLGDADGCLNAGYARDELGDLTAAFENYERACNLGNSTGCSKVANAYREGRGVTRDPARATKMFTERCRSGDSYACDALVVFEAHHTTAAERFATWAEQQQGGGVAQREFEHGHKCSFYIWDYYDGGFFGGGGELQRQTGGSFDLGSVDSVAVSATGLSIGSYFLACRDDSRCLTSSSSVLKDLRTLAEPCGFEVHGSP